MNNDQKTNGTTPIPRTQRTNNQCVRTVPPVVYATQAQQPQQLLASIPQTPQIDPSQLLMNPHTAAMVATVVAAAAQQMAQHQHVVQVMQPSAASQQTPSQQPQHPAHATVTGPPAPPSSSSTIPVSPVGLPHLATLLGVSAQAPTVFQKGASVSQAQVVAASNGSSSVSAALLSNMQNWKLDQLEAHVHMLRERNQAIPQPIAMLLADARRKEEKRTAKRVANRKSACTSRARKKALVEEMTRTNARLKRQALILALLPDLVIAITIEGEITFCSAQVERVLRHKIEDLIGANLSHLLIPPSRAALKSLIGELAAAERAAAGSSTTVPVAAAPSRQASNARNENKEDNNNGHGHAHASAQSSSVSSNGAAVVSDQSFPLSIVKVEPSRPAENSDLSTSNGKSTLAPASTNTNSNNSGTVQSVNLSLEHSAQRGKGDMQRKDKQSSNDDSLSSSSDAKNLRNANANLNRNVRWHNEKMMSKSKLSKAGSAHKDDVIGEAVTPNNAGARLSSLQHRPVTKKKMLDNQEEDSSSSSDSLLAGVEEKKKNRGKNGNSSSSDESGYRESNESAREDSSSSASDMSCGNGRRHKPLAPTCNICLICEDLTTIWCEVTSSIRTRSLKDEIGEGNQPVSSMGTSSNGKSTKSSFNLSEESLDTNKDEIKELLLCLRPIRDGEEKVSESLRFLPKKVAGKMEGDMIFSSADAVEEVPGKGPMKKRRIQQPESCTTDDTAKISQSSSSAEGEPQPKKMKETDDDAEKSVVESLMLMGGYEK